MINVRDVESGLREAPQEVLRVADAESLARFAASTGDVLLTCRGVNFRAALVPAVLAGAVFSVSIIAIRPGPALSGPVILAYLQSEPGQAALHARTRGSVTTANITRTDVMELAVPMPPPEVQERIAALLKVTEASYHVALGAARARRELGLAVVSSLLHEDALLRQGTS